jgi:D-mannonate dehydratase
MNNDPTIKDMWKFVKSTNIDESIKTSSENSKQELKKYKALVYVNQNKEVVKDFITGKK